MRARSTERARSGRNAEIGNAQQRKLLAQAKRSAYLDTLNHLPEIPEGRDTKKHGRPGVRSGSWRAVFEYIAKRWPEAVTNDQMMGFVVSSGLGLSRTALRAQLSAYTEKGFLERAHLGIYRITPQGAAELGLSLDDAAASEAIEAPNGMAAGASEAGGDSILARSVPSSDQPPFPDWEKGR